MTTGQWVLLVCVLLVVGFAMYRVATDGQFRGNRRRRVGAGTTSGETAATVLTSAGVAVPLGERATLVQFSSAFCAPCRATRRVLGEVAELVPGVTHVEIDAEHHLDAVRSLRVLRTPTTLILDAEGREVSRASGQPQRDQVLVALDRT
ncbi:MAG TPA: thioredoxin family protein [Nocardioides sp.]|nr:thioredoxin family protein [Nocardioides sp.]